MSFLSNIRHRTQDWVNKLNPFARAEEQNQDSHLLPDNEVIEPEIVFSVFAQENAYFEQQSDKLPSAVEQKISGNAKAFWKLGYEDGGQGLNTQAITSMVKTQVLSIRDDLRAVLQGKVASLKIEQEVHKNIKAYHEKQLDFKNQYHKELHEYEKKYPRKFSGALGWIYGVVAVFLVAADIPLALKLTNEGFDFSYPWEKFLLSIGIALCTIFIKIIYDDMVGSPLSAPVVRLKNWEGVEADEEKQKLKEVSQTRTWIHVSILAFTLITIVVLGIFRADVMAYSAQFETTNTGTGTIPIWNRPIAKITFILITILFPLIGGICASLSLDCVQNKRQLNRIEKDRSHTEASHLKQISILTEKETELENLTHLLKRCTSDEFMEHYQSFFLDCYRHGFDRGTIQPEQFFEGNSLYSMLEALRTKIISRRSLNVLYKHERDQPVKIS
ncbi:MAG: hypothetical protein AAFN93_18155 [Bacteroidota bacterium]